MTDETGAVIPNAKVTVTGPPGVLKTTTAGADGSYTISALPPGDYTIAVSAPDLTMPPLKVTLRPGVQAKDLRLKVASVTQQVTVQENSGPTVSTEASNNASALVLRGEDLEALADDPDELQEDLQALAGPAAGPDGGQMYIDGFLGGQLPPKDSIREVRINQNPFSPEFDKLGYGRIEIFTKPGTDKFHGQGFYNFGDDVFNSRNPYAAQKAPFLLNEFGGTLSGPINKRASFFLDVERRMIDNGSVIDAITLDPNTLGVLPFTSVLTTPQRRTSIAPRFDYQLTPKNTLTFRYNYVRNDAQNYGIGNFSLASRGYNFVNDNQTVQLVDTIVLNSSVINESRFRYFHINNQNITDNNAPAIDVLGAFNGGGSQLGHSYDIENNFEYQNYTSITHGGHTWKFGGQVRGYLYDSVYPNNFGGTFTFGGGLAPQLDANNQPILDASGQPVLAPITSIERYRRTLLFQGLGYTPAQIRSLGGGATQFGIANGTPGISADQMDAGIFVNDDWRVRPKITLSLGLRYEVQTNIQDAHDFAPRIGVAWALGGSKTKPSKTVLRAGFGLFYTRFPLASVLNALRFNGIVQQNYVLTNPDFFPTIPPIAGLTGFQSTQAIEEISASMRAPYLMQSAFSLERQLPGRTTVSVTYTNSHGLHMLRSQDINAPLPGTYSPSVPNSGVFPYGNIGPINLMESAGLYNQNMVMVNVNSRMNSRISIFGHYMWNHAFSNTDGLNTFSANPYSMQGEYGPAATDIPNRLFLGGYFNVRWGVFLSPFVIIQSGVPFDITIGRDVYGDTLFNSRPGIPTDLSKPGLIQTPYGMLDPNPSPGEAILPRNYGRGPAQFTLNLRLGKTWGFGPERGGGSGMNSGGGGPGGHGHGGWFSPATTSHRYNLIASISARNILNHVNPGPIIGDITSPLFGQANQIAGGFGAFSEAANNRRLELQMRFIF